MNNHIMPPRDASRKRFEEAVKRIESEYEPLLKSASPQAAAKLRKQMQKEIKREKRKAMFLSDFGMDPPVMWSFPKS